MGVWKVGYHTKQFEPNQSQCFFNLICEYYSLLHSAFPVEAQYADITDPKTSPAIDAIEQNL